MKKSLIIAAASFAFIAGAAFGQAGKGGKGAKVHDWKDLDRVHNKVVAAIKDMNKARAANHYDMDGHGAKAEDLLKQAEGELKLAIESARKAG